MDGNAEKKSKLKLNGEPRRFVSNLPPGPGPGRRPGVPNKMTMEVKKAIEMAFEGIGGVPNLIVWAENNQTEFFKSIWVKLLPSKIEATGANGQPLFGPDQLIRMADEIRACEKDKENI